MFGADTSLVLDAIQMVAVAAGFTGAAVYLIMRRKRRVAALETPSAPKDDLEQRVRVLERIATDPATRLAEEFEALEREERQTKETNS